MARRIVTYLVHGTSPDGNEIIRIIGKRERLALFLRRLEYKFDNGRLGEITDPGVGELALERNGHILFVEELYDGRN